MPYGDLPQHLPPGSRRAGSEKEAPGGGPARARRSAGIAVVDLDLAGPRGPVLSCAPAPGGPEPEPGGDAYALVRLRGEPVGTVLVRLPHDEDPAVALAAAYRAWLDGVRGPAPAETLSAVIASVTASGRTAGTAAGVGATDAPAAVPLPPPRTSVVVATRERAGILARALDSLLAQDHADFTILVVDNAPATSATRDLVRNAYAGRVGYVREPVPGLAAAHNRGLGTIGQDREVVAFTDDDVVADPHWLTALTRPFADDPGLGCATGLILPARLGTPAQILLESHGGFAKGFAPRVYDPADPPADEPLFPFTAGSFGSGANMAFRAGALRAVGGFDPATGTGTPARGGDDLYGFVRILGAGHRLRYTPDALVWHHHRETWQDLRNQAYGYGAGLTAYLTAVLVRQPALLPALLARLPRGLAHARAITAARPAVAGPGGGEGPSGGVASAGPPAAGPVPGEHGGQAHPWPRSLSRLERAGMLYGPVGYLRARLAQRGGRRS
ncbi:glycosyltransferase [Streptomyces fuscigenes]|uniref:glycosyltransferase n=1 Tax=Streptomyces fuscigenes TaxID=1528880 RepID=UPI001F482770|nr:glycosyltransferase [Streptomyces fuscigenes]MCF3960751.1 glycosyltransferase [Streptomyces fuscigenes]